MGSLEIERDHHQFMWNINGAILNYVIYMQDIAPQFSFKGHDTQSKLVIHNRNNSVLKLIRHFFKCLQLPSLQM